MKKRVISKFVNGATLIFALSVPIVALWKTQEVKQPKQLMYVADSYVGTVQKKIKVEESYNLVIDGDYFSVDKEQYKAVEVGDKVFGFLNKRE